MKGDIHTKFKDNKLNLFTTISFIILRLFNDINSTVELIL
jgi:hypothetical protein